MRISRRMRWLSIVAGCGIAGVYLLNASWLAPVPRGQALLLAHRGIHQRFDHRGIGRDTCTARRMLPPTNPFLENTIPSMRASFAAGAEMLEIDIHPTTDGDFAVFHDWTLDCRTDGHGVTREQRMADLKALDIGWGYTADSGRTFPFRGKGVGMMPTLIEVLWTFPRNRFLLNFKSRDAGEADRLFAYLQGHRIDIGAQIMVYGHERPVERWQALTRGAPGFTLASAKRCTVDYLLWGWSAIVPESCRNGAIAVAVAQRRLAWGWPNRFLQRMRDAGTTVILLGNVRDKEGGLGIADPAALNAVPAGFGGIVWTDEIEKIGPAWRARRSPGAGKTTDALPLPSVSPSVP